MQEMDNEAEKEEGVKKKGRVGLKVENELKVGEIGHCQKCQHLIALLLTKNKGVQSTDTLLGQEATTFDV